MENVWHILAQQVQAMLAKHVCQVLAVSSMDIVLLVTMALDLWKASVLLYQLVLCTHDGEAVAAQLVPRNSMKATSPMVIRPITEEA
jgi:hypothetical protein